ncbi:hypothetical protein Poly24_35580 [Rosistilla carotiformis]|uniref:Cna protein B-type domain protein n=1 Tax=Rosistilla carotiformis TaxID=2528017 RepID=A0A518JWC4_9BACT|nr:carboxypeptidase-like regulatory domain-containing protein [Rosistilla carotiformis]QDV69841.1 hypothetical protein Poly24_35580 [Rosistilla carotiformis]
MTNLRVFACSLLFLCGSIASAQNDAGIQYQGIDSSLAQQWVHVDSTGAVHGQIDVPAAGGLRRADLARIALVPLGVGEGAATLRGKATLEGSFTIQNVPTGTYALVVHSSSVTASYVVHVLPASDEGASGPLQVLAARTSSAFVMQRVRSYIPLQSALPYSVHQFDADPIANRKPTGEGQVFANAAGSVTGRLALPVGKDGKAQPLQNMNVIVVQGDKSVAMATVDSDGGFTIPKLTPGSYGLVAAGESGFAVVGFELTVPTTASRSADAVRFVSFHAAAVGETELNVEVVPGFAVDQLEDELQRDEKGELEEVGEGVVLDEFGWPVDPNAAQMGPSPSTAGSAQAGTTGGGGGGGGGAGGLGGLGAIGLAAAALAVQNSDNVASPASP